MSKSSPNSSKSKSASTGGAGSGGSGDQQQNTNSKKPDPTPPVDLSTIKTAGVVERMLTTERAMPNVQPPNWEPLPRKKVFDAKGVPITENLKAHFQREGLLAEADAIEILNRAAAIFRKEPNLMRLNDPITVCGDIH